MNLLQALLGRPLSTEEEGSERVSMLQGVAVFGLDALGSAAYGPEAALTVLLPLGLAGLKYMVPVSLVIAALLGLVFLSYLQTVSAYPNGGGAYTVAGENLGARMGILAGAALMIDYLLNVSVGISTGIGALVSAVPKLQPHTLGLCLAVLAVLVLANLRGQREAGILWTIPTYLFVLCLALIIVVGLTKAAHAGGHPKPLVSLKAAPTLIAVAGPWILIRAFAAGCTALTGVEAVSNGINFFADPKERNAKGTLTFIVTTLALLLLGISWLVRVYRITATEPGSPGYESVLSMLTGAVMGRGWFYYIAIGSILMVLSLSANTSFAGFPQLCNVMAEDGYLPKAFTQRGQRLAYTTGILVLGVLSAGILATFGGITDRLIPLFAVGAFMAFTLSQAGMVGHWHKSDDRRAKVYMAINGTGALATGATVLIVFVAKFKEGAWVSGALFFFTVLLLSSIKQHNERVRRILHVDKLTLPLPGPQPVLLVPVAHWTKASLAALQFACSLSTDVRVLHISDIQGEADEIWRQWQTELDNAAEENKVTVPRVISICSPYRSIVDPLMEYVVQTEREQPGRHIGVVIGEAVTSRRFAQVLINYRMLFLRWKLFVSGNRRVAIIDMPWQVPHTSSR